MLGAIWSEIQSGRLDKVTYSSRSLIGSGAPYFAKRASMAGVHCSGLAWVRV